MVNKIFRKNISFDWFYEFCEKHLIINSSSPINGITNSANSTRMYTLTLDRFKHLEFYNVPQSFVETLKKYYYPSKHFYLTRKLTYKRFATILRQICKHLNIQMKSNITYFRNEYYTEYIIIFRK